MAISTCISIIPWTEERSRLQSMGSQRVRHDWPTSLHFRSIITLNVNGLNAPTKSHRLAEWIQKQDPHICCLQETHFRLNDMYRLNVREWKNIFHANGKQKKGGVVIHMSEKIHLNIKITRDKERHYIMIKGTIQEEDLTIVNIYAPNIGAPQYKTNTNRHKRSNWQ